MTDPTLDAVNAVRGDVKGLRDELTIRLDAMVTRREHEAEVRRIDSEAQRTREQLMQHEREADRRLVEISTEVTIGDKAILGVVEADKAQRSAEAKALAEQRRTDRRWTIGALTAATGVIIAAGQLLRVLL
ncbi:hypothetical protein [Oerskovia enterophila]|uniref:Uncharacterized protein n=1 Tax=Oerskovia enterophila TaxID=43678 RepID=A0A163QUU3_9CELL|nr:hypothetical protein [Oerskovia enterophila]KZM34555.1 hypothetical protein OJAG_28540 [Oerskovia enterophila]